MAAAQRVAADAGRGREHRIMRVDLAGIGGSALDRPAPSPCPNQARHERAAQPPSIPVTYVPARNTIMLSLALGWAEVLGAEAIFVGVNAVDYSGYPDCRPEYLEAFETMARPAGHEGRRGRARPLQLARTAGFAMSKAEIIRSGPAPRNRLRRLTVSCYQADEAGRACGRCDSCRLRQSGICRRRHRRSHALSLSSS